MKQINYKKIFIAILYLSIQLYAQSPFRVTSIDSIGKFEAIPNDITFDLLGLSGNTIQQPGTISEILLSFQPIIDKGGSISPGFAVSFAPYQLLNSDQLQLKDYINDYGVRLLSNIQLSIGGAPSLNADSSQDWGIGARINFFNTGDGRLNKEHINQLVQFAERIFGIVPLGNSPTPEIMKLRGKALNGMVMANNYIVDYDNGEKIDINSLKKEIDTLYSIADKLFKLDPNTYKYQPKASIDSMYKISEAIELKKAIKRNNDTSAWNTSTLSLNIGTVYRASKAIITKSQFDRFRIWLNGGLGIASFQLLGQVGWFHQYQDGVKNDSDYVTSALMCRYGNKDFRFGVGGNGKNLKSGSVVVATEIRISSMGWIVASFNRDFEKGKKPTWNPGITFKITGLGL